MIQHSYSTAHDLPTRQYLEPTRNRIFTERNLDPSTNIISRKAHSYASRREVNDYQEETRKKPYEIEKTRQADYAGSGGNKTNLSTPAPSIVYT